MDIFSQSNYKLLLKLRVKELAQAGKPITLQSLAKKIPIQNTYLSKSFNHEKTHLNEDHLFRVCQILEFLPDETEYIFLLRSHDISQEPARKSILQKKINRIRVAKDRSAEMQEFGSRQLGPEMGYLFDPLCIIVHVALFIPEYARNPRALVSALGITQNQLRNILRKIEAAGYIELDSHDVIKRVSEQQIHYGTDHPLMRVHQNLLRQKTSLHLQTLNEDEKQSFMGTFSADPETVVEIKKKYRDFLKEVERLVIKAPSKNIFQMNFDLFKWL
jgi:hypothetical protein